MSGRRGGARRRGRRAQGPPFLLSPLGIVFTTVMIDLIGFGIVLPILPLWAEQFGGSPVQIGIITASYAVAQLIFAPIWGRLSDTHGRRPIILFSLAGAAVAALITGLAQGLLIIFLARVLQGAAGASYVAAQAYVADVTSPRERAHGMGLIGAAFGLGFLLGPAIGALCAAVHPRLPFFVAAALALANLAVAWRRLPESRRPGSPTAAIPGWAVLRRGLASRRLAPLVWLTFLTNLAFVAMETTLALFGAARFGYDMAAMGMIFAYVGLMAVVSQGLLVRRMVPRLGESRVLLIGLMGTALGLALLAGAQGLVLLLVALGVLSLASGLVFSVTAAMISHAAGDHEQGTILGLTGSVSSAARIAAPLAGTLLFQHVSLGAPYLAGAAIFALCAAAAAWSMRRSPVIATP